MTDRPAAIQGTFADYRLIKTRGVLALVIEVPVERQAEVFAALGYPMPGEEKPVAVARLQSYPSAIATDAAEAVVPTSGGEDAGGGTQRPVPRHPQPYDPMKAAVTRAVMLCRDRRFQQWIGYTRDMGPGGLAEANTKAWLLKHCEIESRAEIANPDAHERFLKLETSYRRATNAAS